MEHEKVKVAAWESQALQAYVGMNDDPGTSHKGHMGGI